MKGIFFDDIEKNYITSILDELYTKKIYAPYFNQLEDQSIIAYDLGANIGLVTFYMYPKCKKIVAVEPSKQHFQKLQAMVEFNNMNRVQLVNKAISDKVGKEILQHSPNITMYSLKKNVYRTETQPELRDYTTEEVDTVDIKTLIGDDTVDFMKMDIEGKEGDIIMSKEFEEICPRIKNLLIELHSWNGWQMHLIQKRIIDLGYAVMAASTDAYVLKCTYNKYV